MKTKKEGNSGKASKPLRVPDRKKTPGQVQEILDTLILKHGANLPNWDTYGEILKEAGLAPEQVTAEGLRLANERAVSASAEAARGEVERRQKGEWVKLVKEAKEGGAGGDLLARVLAAIAGRSGVDVADVPDLCCVANGRCRSLLEETGLTPALFTPDVVRAARRIARGGGRLADNREHFVTPATETPYNNPATEDGDNGATVENGDFSYNGEGIMKITETAARRLFAAMERPGVDGWNEKKLAANLKKLPDLLEEAKKLKGKDAALFRAACKAIGDGKEVGIESTGNGKAEKATAAAGNGRTKPENADAVKIAPLPELELRTVSIDDVKPAKYNPPSRTDGSRKWKQLKQSIASRGLRVPVAVTKGMVLIDGHRRWTVCKELGYTKINVLVHPDGKEMQTGLYAELSSTGAPASGQDSLHVYLEAPDALSSYSRTLSEKAEGLLGRDLLEQMRDAGASMQTYKWASAAAKYCGKDGDGGFMADTVRYILKYKAQPIRMAIRHEAPSKVIERAITSGKPLESKFVVSE